MFGQVNQPEQFRGRFNVEICLSGPNFKSVGQVVLEILGAISPPPKCLAYNKIGICFSGKEVNFITKINFIYKTEIRLGILELNFFEEVLTNYSLLTSVLLELLVIFQKRHDDLTSKFYIKIMPYELKFCQSEQSLFLYVFYEERINGA